MIDGKAIPMIEDDILKRFPNGYKYLKQHEDILRGREKGKMNKDGWFLYIYPKNLYSSNQIKLVSPDITMGLQLTKDNDGVCVKDGAYGISFKEGVNLIESNVLAILNSNLLWFYLKNTGNVLRGGYFRFKTKYISPFPVIKLDELENIFEEKIKRIFKDSENLSNVTMKFHRLLFRKFNLEKLPKKLQEWNKLTFAEFTKELKKKKIKLGLSEEAEWEDYFEAEKAKAQAIQSEIDQTDRAIDQMVYELYGLTEEEIRIVEGS